MSDEKAQWVAARAYAIWEEQGKPFGRDHEHWWQASQERDHLEATRASHDGTDIIAKRIAADDARKKAVEASGASVLVVEDEPYIRMEAVDTFHDAGFTAFEAENADDAMSIMRSNPVGAVFTDITMPGSMDGVALASKVKALWPKTQIIITSGLIKLARKDLGKGIQFFPKPVRLPHVVDLMRRKLAGA